MLITHWSRIMGKWDETCGLTNTPIFEHAPAVLVVFEAVVETEGLQQGWSFADQVVSIHKGEYNGYGGVGEVVPRMGDLTGVLFHGDVWDACLTLHGKAKSEYAADVGAANAWRKVNGKSAIAELGELTAVLQVAYIARRDVLSGLKFKGMQDCNGRKPYEFVIGLAQRHLPERPPIEEG